MKISIRQLSVFRAVAQDGRVTCAAEKLFMSQPAASMALSELEKQLDCQLFNRQGNRLVLNERGRILLPLGNEILSRTAEIEHLFSTTNTKKMIGHIQVGASNTLGNYLLPSIVRHYMKKAPHSHVTLDINEVDYLVDKLLNFHITIGFIEEPCFHPDIQVIPWIKDRLIIVAPKEHALAQEKSIPLSQLASDRWVMQESKSSIRKLFEQTIAGRLENLNIHVELNHTEAIKQAVIMGLGISCISSLSVARSADLAELCILNVADFEIKRQINIIVHKKHPKHGILQSFLESIKTYSQENITI